MFELLLRSGSLLLYDQRILFHPGSEPCIERNCQVERCFGKTVTVLMAIERKHEWQHWPAHFCRREDLAEPQPVILTNDEHNPTDSNFCLFHGKPNYVTILKVIAISMLVEEHLVNAGLCIGWIH